MNASWLARSVVKVADVQADEIWGFVQKKEAHKRPSEANDNSIGDACTFVAIERDSKLVLNFALGRRDTATTQAFVEGLRDAIAPGTFQISTDGFGPYVPAMAAGIAHTVWGFENLISPL